MFYLLVFIGCCLIWGFSMQLVLLFAGAFILYWLLTAKKRRAKIMFTHIYTLVASGAPFTVLDHINFEAALKFALEHGGKLEPQVRPQYANEIDLPMNIEGTNYMIGIARLPSGKTWLGAIDMDEQKRQFKQAIKKAADGMRINLAEYTFKPGSAPAGTDEEQLEAAINEWLELVQNQEVLDELMVSMQTDSPISAFGGAARVNILDMRLTELTGESAEELFGQGGLFKYLIRREDMDEIEHEPASPDEIPF